MTQSQAAGDGGMPQPGAVLSVHRRVDLRVETNVHVPASNLPVRQPHDRAR
jgi:hypothetical protein